MGRFDRVFMRLKEVVAQGFEILATDKAHGVDMRQKACSGSIIRNRVRQMTRRELRDDMQEFANLVTKGAGKPLVNLREHDLDELGGEMEVKESSGISGTQCETAPALGPTEYLDLLVFLERSYDDRRFTLNERIS